MNTFKFINAEGDIRFVKFHWKSQQGIKNLTSQEAQEIQGKDFSHMTRDLYENIAQGNYPKWDLMVKVIEPKDLKSLTLIFLTIPNSGLTYQNKSSVL